MSTMDSGEDARKKRQTKRDCTEVVQQPDTSVLNEKPKKLKKVTAKKDSDLRNENPSVAVNADTTVSKDGSETINKAPKVVRDVSEAQSARAAGIRKQHKHAKGQDLESALNSLIEQDEPLSEDSYLSFRLGHAGDASPLASLYREAKSAAEPRKKKENTENESGKDTPTKTQTESTEASSSLEIWLEKGLGNEDIPPSLFAILAHVKYPEVEGSNKASKLAAVALLTLAWENSKRVLRVEWFHVDTGLVNCRLVEPRMWLRLAALSLMTTCELYVVEQKFDGKLPTAP